MILGGRQVDAPAAEDPAGRTQSRPAAISVVVHGRQRTAGSKRAFTNPKTGRVIIAPDAKRAKEWQEHVAQVCGEWMTTSGTQMLDGPCGLGVRFELPRPKSHYGTGRNAGKLKPSAPRCHAQKPDVTKLVRAVEDALCGVAIRDDAQVAFVAAVKTWGEAYRTFITIQPVEEAR